MYLINARNRCVRAFVPGPRDRQFIEDEWKPTISDLINSLGELLLYLGRNEKYHEYLQRQRDVGCV